MTKKELINSMKDMDEDAIVVLVYGQERGWSNIETVEAIGSVIEIAAEEYPIFSDN